MSEHTQLFERAAARFEPPDLPMEGLLKRRDRRRRHQRIAAFVVAIAVVFVPVGVVATSGTRDTDLAPKPAETGTTAPSPPGPTVAPEPTVSPEPEAAASPIPESQAPDPGLARVNVIELPPEGATPSAPEDGELLFAARGRGVATDRLLTHMYLYADGRLIWWREGDLPEGVDPHGTAVEQHLTPEGAELLRSEIVASGLFDRGDIFMGGEADPDPLAFWGGMRAWNGERLVDLQLGWTYVGPDSQYEGDTIMTATQERALKVLDGHLADLASWLPASAWADRQVKEYVPSTYRVCYGGTRETMAPDRIVDALPGRAQELLGSKAVRDMTVPGYAYPVRVTYACSDVTTDEARVLVQSLEDGGFQREERPTYANDDPFIRGGYAASTFEYLFPVNDQYQEASLWIDPYLPHGEAPCFPCG